MTWRIVLLAGAAGLALAGCGRQQVSPGQPPRPAAAALTAQLAEPAPPTLPKRRPGLWKQTVIGSGATQVSRLCLDADADAKLAIWGSQTGGSICAEQEVRPSAGGWAFHSRCDLNSSGTVVSDGVATGDFNSNYAVEVQSTTTGATAAQMNGAHKISIQAQWQGPCPVGMKPGDMSLPNGVKINMLRLGSEVK